MKLFKKWKARKHVVKSSERFTRYGLEFLDSRSPDLLRSPHQVILFVPHGTRAYYWNYGWNRDVAIREMAAEKIYDLYFADCLAGVQPKPTGEFGQFFKLITSPDRD